MNDDVAAAARAIADRANADAVARGLGETMTDPEARADLARLIRNAWRGRTDDGNANDPAAVDNQTGDDGNALRR